MLVFFSRFCFLPFANTEPNACGGSLRKCFPHREDNVLTPHERPNPFIYWGSLSISDMLYIIFIRHVPKFYVDYS